MPSFFTRWFRIVVPRIAFLLTVWGTVLMAQDLNRDMDVVVLRGDHFAKLLDKDVASLRLCRFANGTTWEAIPFQVDERTGSSDTAYFNIFKNGVLDVNDEIVFSAQDAGGRAPSDQEWPNEVTSKNHARYEIRLYDARTGLEGYVYLFWSPFLPLSRRSYMQYVNDGVSGSTYHIGHNYSRASGLPDTLYIPASAGGDQQNILDRLRLRIYTTASHSIAKDLTLEIKENWNKSYAVKADILGQPVTIGDLTLKVNFSKVKSLAGPIRVIRKNYMTLTFTLDVKSGYEYLGLSDIGPKYYDFSIGLTYYPHYYEVPYDVFDVPLENAIKGLTDQGGKLKNTRIILATVMNTNGLGMRYLTPRLADETVRRAGFKIDGNSDQTIYRNPGYLSLPTDWPGRHWWAIVPDAANPASPLKKTTLFMMADLRGNRPTVHGDLPAGQEIPYQDRDTEDGRNLYGLNGVQLHQKENLPPNLAINLTMRQYALPGAYNYDQLLNLFDQYRDFLQVTSSHQFNDKIRPGVIRDLRIAQRTDTSIKLAWSGVGDDGDNDYDNPVTTYLVRFSTEKPHPDSLWKWWDRATLSYPGPPLAMPGNPIQFTVSNLNRERQYWFGLIAQDEAGNISQTIAMATSVTTPVELSSFTARAFDQTIELRWNTASESNNLGFEVQRRHETESTWQTLAFLEGQGTTAEPTRYVWRDQPGRAGKINYRLNQVDADGQSHLTEAISVAFLAPKIFALQQNFPNPFNPATAIHYEVPEGSAQRVDIIVYDLLGRRVKTLVSETAQAGYYRIVWDGLDDRGAAAGAGVYFCVLTTAETRLTRKMIKVQ